MDNFGKFKKQILIEYSIKCGILGLVVFFAGLLIFALLTLININFMPLWLEAIILFALGIIVAVALFFIKKPTDIDVARRIDADYKLKNKVETMIEFKDSNEAMADLQRKDAHHHIGAWALKKFKFKFSLALVLTFAIVFVLSSTATGFAIAKDVISNSNNPGYVNPSDDPTIIEENESDMVKKLRKLVNRVKMSAVDERLKDDKNMNSYTYAIYNLIKSVKNVESNSLGDDAADEILLKALAVTTIGDIKTDMSIINTNEKISTVLKASQYTRAIGVQIGDLKLGELDKALNNFAIIVLTDDVPNRTQPEEGSSNNDDVKEDESFEKEIIRNLASALIDEEDNLYKAVINYLNHVVYSEDRKVANDEAKPLILSAVTRQLENYNMANTLAIEISRIFGIQMENNENNNNNNNKGDEPSGELYRPERPDGSSEELNPDDGDNDSEGVEGGFGSGEIEYGSNDLFYDPLLGVIKYGTVIDQYSAIIYQMVADGLLSEEEAEYYTSYFDRLYGSKK